MGMLSNVKKKRVIDVFDFITFLFIIALFVFENEKYGSLFSIIQGIFIGYSVFEALKNRYIVYTFAYKWAWLFFFVAFILTCVFCESNIPTIVIILKNAIRCICVAYYASSRGRAEKMIVYLALGGVICSCFVFSRFIESSMVFSNIRYSTNDRIGADIAGGNVNIVAMNLVFSFVSWLYLFSNNSEKKIKVASLFCLIVVFVATMLTGTRKALLCMTVVSFIYSLSFKSGKIRNFFLFLLVILLAYYLLLEIKPLYYLMGHKIDVFSGKNYYTMYSESDSTRLYLVREGLNLFFENMLTGVGYGNTPMYLGYYTHNNYVEMLAGGGIFGFILYYSMYVYLFCKCPARSSDKTLLKFVFLMLVALAVLDFSQVTYLYGLPWVFLGLAAPCCDSISLENKF